MLSQPQASTPRRRSRATPYRGAAANMTTRTQLSTKAKTYFEKATAAYQRMLEMALKDPKYKGWTKNAP